MRPPSPSEISQVQEIVEAVLAKVTEASSTAMSDSQKPVHAKLTGIGGLVLIVMLYGYVQIRDMQDALERIESKIAKITAARDP